MRYFIGVVPPQRDSARIASFRQRWGALRTEPHITVKAPGGLTDERTWLDRVRDACKPLPAFPVSLGGPGMFGQDVLFLRVDSTELLRLHSRLVAAVGAAPGPFELGGYTPHLSLGERDHGLTTADLAEMGRMAAVELCPFPSFQVEFIRVYGKEEGSSAYRKLADIPLSGTCMQKSPSAGDSYKSTFNSFAR